jgi:hypothetical protein
MWCSSCQQDVAAVADSGDARQLRCARCQTSLPSTETAEAARIAATCASELPFEADDCELDSELRNVQRLTSSLRNGFAAEASPQATGALAGWQNNASGRLASQLPEQNSARHPRGGFFAWGMISLGVTTFVCGSVLLGWSFFADRPDLRTLGLPLTLAGQAALIVGLVLQLEGLWHSNRQTRESLDDLDGQLDELRHATTLITTSHSAAGQSFYAHMAEGASPELLLADLKGQMDLLAQRMAAQRRAA